jgi:hypothetical protein
VHARILGIIKVLLGRMVKLLLRRKAFVCQSLFQLLLAGLQYALVFLSFFLFFSFQQRIQSSRQMVGKMTHKGGIIHEDWTLQ